jgi:hypothetical protein
MGKDFFFGVIHGQPLRTASGARFSTPTGPPALLYSMAARSHGPVNRIAGTGIKSGISRGA